MNEMCPGLPDWKALDACAAKLATAETGTKGRFVGPPADWGKHYSERIEALKMNFQEVPVGQAATLWAELQAAYDRKEPVVLFNWTPNFIEAKFEGQFVEFPKYEADCFTDPKWGSNPDAIYDCGAPAQGYLKKAGSKQLGEKWPKATEFLKKVNFTNPQIASVGITDREALEQGLDVMVATQRYSDVAYGWALEDTESFCKLIADRSRRVLIGAHIIGPQSSSLIQQLIHGIRYETSIDDMARGQYYIHPALGEVVENALLQVPRA
jgi:hypothetical protein